MYPKRDEENFAGGRSRPSLDGRKEAKEDQGARGASQLWPGMGCIRNVTGKTSPAAAAALALMEEKKQKKIKALGAPANFGRVLLFLDLSSTQRLNTSTNQHLNTTSSFPRRTAG